MLKETHIAGVNRFLNDLNPQTTAQDLVDDRFVKQAIERGSFQSVFKLQGWTLEETFIV